MNPPSLIYGKYFTQQFLLQLMTVNPIEFLPTSVSSELNVNELKNLNRRRNTFWKYVRAQVLALQKSDCKENYEEDHPVHIDFIWILLQHKCHHLTESQNSTPEWLEALLKCLKTNLRHCFNQVFLCVGSCETKDHSAKAYMQTCLWLCKWKGGPIGKARTFWKAEESCSDVKFTTICRQENKEQGSPNSVTFVESVFFDVKWIKCIA